MPKEYSKDLQWRVVYLYNDYFSITNIVNTLYISKFFVIRIINLYKKWACVTNPFKGIPGRRKLFSKRNMYIFQSLVKDKVNWYLLNELICKMENLTKKRVSILTFWRLLYYLGIIQKKV